MKYFKENPKWAAAPLRFEFANQKPIHVGPLPKSPDSEIWQKALKLGEKDVPVYDRAAVRNRATCSNLFLL